MDLSSIKFKIEIENNNCLPFLDTLVIRNNGQLKFDVYRKPTAVDSYIHFFSNHHISVKKSVFSCMFLRALRICDPEYFDVEIERIFNTGKTLCYPLGFLESCFSKTKKKFYENSQRDRVVTSNTLSLPFRLELKPLVGLLKSLKINVVFRYENTIKNIIVKNSPSPDRNIGVYSIPCNFCNQKYIGQTGKLLDERLKQHRYNVSKGDKSSALFIHMQEYDHNTKCNESAVIYSCNRTIERLIVEGVIIKTSNNMNLSDSLFKIDNFMLNAIKNNSRVKQALSLCGSTIHK